ncbi:MAG: aminodeoxychorismate/anthranilate synthase component II [Halobacteriovoraceae bacterium]|nr:aminodeoxychorismate/anthranilate synthase component II [Halobacteriovoraceae bacterium]
MMPASTKTVYDDCVLLDFADSFTYNIAAALHRQNISCQVIPLKNAALVLKELSPDRQKRVIIYGPGPGTPYRYSSLFSLIKPLLLKPNFFHLGICLGHQLLAILRGHRVGRCSHPRHGQRQEFTIPPWPDVFPRKYIDKKTMVQRYNSLTVKRNKNLPENIWPDTGEVLACRFSGGVSFQFHPESIGTSFPALFFNPIAKFLYNKRDEQRNSNRRRLR